MQTTLEYRGQLLNISVPSGDSCGRGATANLLRGTVVTGAGIEHLALKVYHTVISPREQELLSREIDVWRSIRHDRILQFYGRCTLGPNQIALVSPFMENGNLCEYLKQNPSSDRLKLLIQVAEGLRYLYCDAGVVHGDIKGENVLISDRGTALIADFGLSTSVDATDTQTATHIRQRKTLRFSAPELLMDEASHESPIEGEVHTPRSKTTFSDVFAFGMLIYQIHTDKPPWPGASDFHVISAIVKGDFPRRPTDGVPGRRFCDSTWKFCEQCWAPDPASRPTITESLTTLRKLAMASRVKRNLNPSAPAFKMDLGCLRASIAAVTVSPALNPQASVFTPRPVRPTIIPTQLTAAQNPRPLNATAAAFVSRTMPLSLQSPPPIPALDPLAAPFTPRAAPVYARGEDIPLHLTDVPQPAHRPQLNSSAAVFVPRGLASILQAAPRPQLNRSAVVFVPRRPPPLTVPTTALDPQRTPSLNTGESSTSCTTTLEEPPETPELVEDVPTSTPSTPSTGPTTPCPTRSASQVFNIGAKPFVPRCEVPNPVCQGDDADSLATMRAVAHALIF